MTAQNQILIYQAPDGQAQIDIQFDGDTIWMSQAHKAMLFEKNADTIGLHLKNIYKTGELEEEPTTEESSVVRKEGGNHDKTDRKSNANEIV